MKLVIVTCDWCSAEVSRKAHHLTPRATRSLDLCRSCAALREARRAEERRRQEQASRRTPIHEAAMQAALLRHPGPDVATEAKGEESVEATGVAASSFSSRLRRSIRSLRGKASRVTAIDRSQAVTAQAAPAEGRSLR